MRKAPLLHATKPQLGRDDIIADELQLTWDTAIGVKCMCLAHPDPGNVHGSIPFEFLFGRDVRDGEIRKVRKHETDVLSFGSCASALQSLNLLEWLSAEQPTHAVIACGMQRKGKVIEAEEQTRRRERSQLCVEIVIDVMVRVFGAEYISTIAIPRAGLDAGHTVKGAL